MTDQSQNLRIMIGQQAGNDIAINVRDFGGSGPVALLHHANGFSAGTWSLLAPGLTPHFRVFAMDARGHGDSDAAGALDSDNLTNFAGDVVAVAEALCKHCSVDEIAYGIGSSFGGVVTAMAASLRSAGIRAEIYVGTSGMRAQMKYADRRGAPCVVIQGGDERAAGTVQIKDMVEGARQAAAIAGHEEYKEVRPGQVTVPDGDLVAEVRKVLDAQAAERAKG